jgi:hypothetical protein
MIRLLLHTLDGGCQEKLYSGDSPPFIYQTILYDNVNILRNEVGLPISGHIRKYQFIEKSINPEYKGELNFNTIKYNASEIYLFHYQELLELDYKKKETVEDASKEIKTYKRQFDL